MRISLELFLLDNFVMNLLGLRLGECLRGERGRCSRLCALGGALWSLAALSRIPFLLTLPGRIVCLILLTVCTGRRGRYGAVFFSLLAAFILLGGGLLLLQLALGIPLQSGGAVVTTVPLRLALYGAGAGMGLVRLMRSLLRRGYAKSREIPVILYLEGRSMARQAFVDTGNLLREPVTGLPVVLLKNAGIQKGAPLFIEGWGEITAAPGELRLDSGERIPVYCGEAPMELAQEGAIVPDWALPHRERRNKYAAIFSKVVLPAAGPSVSQEKECSVVSADGRESACSPEPGRGEPLRHAGPAGGVGPEQAHRA